MRDKRGTSTAAPSFFLDPKSDGFARQWSDQYVMYTMEQFAVRHIVQVDIYKLTTSPMQGTSGIFG